ncbi:MAG TPA: RsmE family RNA methyltransferase [Terriglobales bacterium]|nr:RsmE family RNA methyltransferase [Terriglobales bacterium]
MTRRRWIADEVSETRAALVGGHARHLSQVLRVRVGQEFEISVGGEVRRGTVTTVEAERVEFELGEFVPQQSTFQIAVAISIFKFDRMEWAIEKCTELGVVRIMPVIAARTEPHLASAAVKRTERWRRIAKQASEQSRRVAAPEVGDPIKLKDLLAVSSGAKIVLSEVEDRLGLRDAIAPEMRSVTLAFGPEGGWKEQELTAFRNAGWVSASLGPTILRAETAVIAAVAIAASGLQG